MNRLWIILAVLAAVPRLEALDGARAPSSAPFLVGADVSALPEVEEHGGVFTVQGVPGDALSIFRDHGVNAVRLRLWHTPAGGYCGLDSTLRLARRAKDLGFRLLLDIHYSDGWADPGQQTKPLAWQGLTFQQLRDSVYCYTRDVTLALKNHGVLPEIVQIGNEIICGMLWNEGRICGTFNTPQQWGQLAELLRAGIRGVKDSLDLTDTVRIMIHIDRGGDNGASRWFFDNLLAQSVDFDIIGLSFYPWWHGTLSALEFNLQDLALRYGKEILLVEAAYPWTLGWNDTTHNIVGTPSQLHPGYPATVDGQREYLQSVLQIVRDTPQDRGAGVFIWAPEWISAPYGGSPWENLALFDFSGELLSSVSAFPPLEVCVPAGVDRGWTMVSLPLEPPRRYPDVFPGALSPPYRFAAAGGYQQDGDTLFPGVGYWLKFGDTTSRTICGTPVDTGDVPVAFGWNLIGALHDTLDTSVVTSNPPGILASPFFHFREGTYRIARTLIPGAAYWVKATTGGIIRLQGTMRRGPRARGPGAPAG